MNQKTSSTCAVIIVTHNSERYLNKCMQCLFDQTVLPQEIIIVDSGSHHKDYLQPYQDSSLVRLVLLDNNVGFCQGNNIGLSHVSNESRYVLFLNPDAFLTPAYLEQALVYMESPYHHHVGAFSGLLLGYDINEDAPTGKIDSTGIFRTFYGRWYDRGQGQQAQLHSYTQNEEVPALCGALMFCRQEALEQVMISPYEVMDKTFYMYKEDIDLSLRLRQKGWSLCFVPSLVAYHCRGWQQNRSHVPKHLRLLSAKNEMRLYSKLRSPCLLYSALKYFAVKFFNA